MNYRWILSSLLLGMLAIATLPVRADSDPSDSVYVAQNVEGDVMVQRNGKDRSVLLREGEEVEAGDEVRVGKESEATLTLGDDQVIRFESDTRVKLAEAQPNKDGGFLTRLQLLGGNLMVEVKHLMQKKSKFEVESGGIICGVRGTIFEVTNDAGEVGAQTHEGLVACASGAGSEEKIKAGEGASFKNRRLLRRAALGKEGRERLKRWRQFRKAIHEMREARREGKIREFRRDRLEKMRDMLRKHPGAKRRLPAKVFKKAR